MAQAHVEAVLEAAVDGISFDGLVVEATGETYRFETPTESHEDVPENELRELCRDSAYVTNWYFWHARAPQSESNWVFLRWLDGIDEADVTESCERVDVLDRYEALRDGIDRTWGELAVTTTLATNGKRRYHLRHVDDTDVSTDTLEVCREREALRELVRFDQRGRYRPLKSAPTLQTGWHAPDCSASQLLDLLSVVYPASVENWYRDRTDTLDVVHWREAMSRQTGIYGIIETWDRGEGHEHVEWVTEACCVDSQCLKRRLWHYDEETPLDTDPGEGKSRVVSRVRWSSLAHARGRDWRENSPEPTSSNSHQARKSNSKPSSRQCRMDASTGFVRPTSVTTPIGIAPGFSVRNASTRTEISVASRPAGTRSNSVR